MATILSDADIDSISRRVVQLMGERLATPPAPPPPERPSREPMKVTMQAPPRLAYKLKELCSEVGLSPVTIYRLEARGLIKSVPGIRTKIYSRAEVEKFLAGKQGGWK